MSSYFNPNQKKFYTNLGIREDMYRKLGKFFKYYPIPLIDSKLMKGQTVEISRKSYDRAQEKLAESTETNPNEKVYNIPEYVDITIMEDKVIYTPDKEKIKEAFLEACDEKLQELQDQIQEIQKKQHQINYQKSLAKDWGKRKLIWDNSTIEQAEDYSIVEDHLEILGRIIKDKFKGYNYLQVKAINNNWRGQTGYKAIKLHRNSHVDIASSLIPDYSCTFELYVEGFDNELYAKVYSHDVPTGATWLFKGSSESEVDMQW